MYLAKSQITGKLLIGKQCLAFLLAGCHGHQPEQELRHAVSAPVFGCQAEFGSRDLNGSIAQRRLKSAKYEKGKRKSGREGGVSQSVLPCFRMCNLIK